MGVNLRVTFELLHADFAGALGALTALFRDELRIDGVGIELHEEGGLEGVNFMQDGFVVLLLLLGLGY